MTAETGWLIGDIHKTNQFHLNYYYQFSNALSVNLGVMGNSNETEDNITFLFQLNLDY